MEPESPPPGQRRARQRTTVFFQSGVESAGVTVRGTIRNLSPSGASLVIDAPVKVDDRVCLSLRNIGNVWGRIVWVDNKRAGVEFDVLIDPSMALATPARSAIPTYGHVYNNKDHKRPGFGPQRMARKG